jgi:hypothetical protein
METIGIPLGEVRREMELSARWTLENPAPEREREREREREPVQAGPLHLSTKQALPALVQRLS